MDVIEREEIADVLRQQPQVLQSEDFDHITVSDVIGLHVPDYIHKALPLRDAFTLGLQPEWVDFFDSLQSTYCQLISKMHKNEIVSNHLHPKFLDNWFKDSPEMEGAYTVLRGISGWAAESHDEIMEAMVDIAMGIPAGHTMHERRIKSKGNVVNLTEYRLRTLLNASIH